MDFSKLYPLPGSRYLALSRNSAYMKILPFTLITLLLFVFNAFGQAEEAKILYIIDSIPVIEDPGPGNDVDANDIEHLTVVKNKDSLNNLGYGQFDGVVFVFTKEYVSRPDSIKLIPSSLQMERKNGVWHFRGAPYSGRFIDYYYNGRKQGEGTFKDGIVDGLRKMYNQNGTVAMERRYLNGIEHGLEREFYEDGSLKQKGEFVNGKHEGVWEMYYPNGQLKQRSTFKDNVMNGETAVYYSTGRILAVGMYRNGKATPDKRLEKINQLMNKGHAANKEGDFQSAIKHYSKAIAFDSLYAEAYFARGTSKLNNLEFDESILDFDKTLALEPFYEKALFNRAVARIRKYQMSGTRKLSQSHGVTVLAQKSNSPGPLPEEQRELICNDLKQAFLLDKGAEKVKQAIAQFCQPVQNP